MRIRLAAVMVDDQAKALRLYTEKLGFTKKHDARVGADRWLTMVSPQGPDGTELALRPSGYPAVKPFKDALVAMESASRSSPSMTSKASTAA